MSTPKILILAASAALIAACAPAPSSPASQTPPPQAAPAASQATSGEPALIEAHQALHQALGSQNVEGVVALLDSSPKLLIFHPLLEDRFDSIDAVRSKLPEMFKHLGKASWTEVHPEAVQIGNVGWITSNLLIESPALPSPFIGRGTEIWVKEANGWRLIHAHWSEVPQRAEGGE